jgi:hypothetical protein
MPNEFANSEKTPVRQGYFGNGRPGPGRPKGSRNALSESFLSALHRDFQQHGEDAIRGAREESPLGYCKVIASLLPAKVELTKTEGTVSDDDLMDIIRAAMAAEAQQSGLVARPVPGPTVDATGNA